MTAYLNTGWRVVHTLHEDTLQKIAYRELGDAALWVDIAMLNGLKSPYLTGDALHPDIADGTVLLFGDNIKVPSSLEIKQSVTANQAFGIDLLLPTDGQLQDDGFGDLAIVAGVPNLAQALTMRLNNERGCLRFHPKYGNLAHRLRGYKSSNNIALLAVRWCEETLLADPRVMAVSDGAFTLRGDAVVVSVTAIVEDGAALRLQIEI